VPAPLLLCSFAASREANRLQPGPAASISRQSNRRGQNSGWKARATSIRVHSRPFVVQNHPCIRVHSWLKTAPAFVSIRSSKRPLHSCPFVVQNHPPIRVHSWFQTTPLHSPLRLSVQIRVNPWRNGPRPSVAEGLLRKYQQQISDWKARATFIRVHSYPFVVQKRPPIRVHSWFKTTPHSCPFVVQNHPCIRVHSWFKTTPAFVSIRGSKHPHSWFPNRTTETSTTRSSPGLKSVVSKSSTAIGVSLSACPGIPALMSPDFNRLNPPVSVLLILWYCTPAEIPHRNCPPPADSTTTKTRATWKRLAGKVRTEEPWRL